MHTFWYVLSPVTETLTILAFLAAIVLVLKVISKMFPKAVAEFKNRTAWMEWDYDEETESPYTEFKIHPSNYIKVPNNR
jgi:hypothetical protein